MTGLAPWSDTLRDRHYEPGYVYIAGSLSNRIPKIGMTVNIRGQEKWLRRDRYGSIDDWVLLYYVWVKERGKTEHDARRRLRRYRSLRVYYKNGSPRKKRELVECRFGIVFEAVTELLVSGRAAGIRGEATSMNLDGYHRSRIPRHTSRRLRRPAYPRARIF